MKKVIIVFMSAFVFSNLLAATRHVNMNKIRICKATINDNSYCDIKFKTEDIQSKVIGLLADKKVYNKQSEKQTAKCLNVDIGCLKIENTNYSMYTIEIDVSDSKDILNDKPDIVYYNDNNYGYAPNGKLFETINEAIKTGIIKFINQWSIYNKQ